MNFVNTFTQTVLSVVVAGLSAIGVQTPLTPPTLELVASPVVVQSGGSATIEWSSTGADECVSGYFDTEKKSSGSVTVSPLHTTTYSVTCLKTNAQPSSGSGVWKLRYSDYTDLWCSNQPLSFKNLYTENPCPSNDPEGQSCSLSGSDTCAVNSWQQKAYSGDRTKTQYCNLISEVYRCVAGTSNKTSAPAPTVTGSKTVFSGEFGDLVAPHLQYRARLQEDVNANGGPFVMDGFYDDKATADRVCSVLFSGSSNGFFKSDKYKSPKNNTLLRWDGTRWTQQSAKNHPRHIRYEFTCVAPGTVQPAPTPLPTTVTKSVTVVVFEPTNTEPSTGGGGGGGANQCTDGIDNDNDGRIDGADYACTPGRTSESPNPQCSDGIDNNGNGLVDTADTASCTGLTDWNELAPPAELSFSGPALVQKGSAATLTWSVQNVVSGSCRIRGNNGDSWTLSGTSGSQTSKALESETTFTLSCTDQNGDPVSQSLIVRIAPTFIEQ